MRATAEFGEFLLAPATNGELPKIPGHAVSCNRTVAGRYRVAEGFFAL
jgi:hypothetical protein